MKDPKYDLIVISGSHEYYILKKSISINEQQLFLLFLYEVIYILRTQKKNGCFIFRILNAFTDITKQLIYILSCNYEKLKIVNLEKKSDVHYIIGINFHGNNVNISNILVKVFLKLNLQINNLGESLNIKDPSLRKLYMVSNSITNNSQFKFIHKLINVKMSQTFINKLNKYNKFYINYKLGVFKKIFEYMKLDFKKDKKIILQIILKKIIFAINYCKKHNIEINENYKKLETSMYTNKN